MIALSSVDMINFHAIHISPQLQCGTKTVGFLGEVGKWVPQSPQRFTSIDCGANNTLVARLHGSQGEHVGVQFAIFKNSVSTIITVDCELGTSGTAVASSDARCTSGIV